MLPSATEDRALLEGGSDVDVPVVPLRRRVPDGAHRARRRDAAQGPHFLVHRRGLPPVPVDLRRADGPHTASRGRGLSRRRATSDHAYDQRSRFVSEARGSRPAVQP